MSVFEPHDQATLLAMHLQSVQSLVHRGRAQVSAHRDVGPNPSAFSLLTELLAALTHAPPVRLSSPRSATRHMHSMRRCASSRMRRCPAFRHQRAGLSESQLWRRSVSRRELAVALHCGCGGRCAEYTHAHHDWIAATAHPDPVWSSCCRSRQLRVWADGSLGVD